MADHVKLTPEVMSSEIYRLSAVTSAHTWMFRTAHGRLAWLEVQILQPGRRLRGGRV